MSHHIRRAASDATLALLVTGGIVAGCIFFVFLWSLTVPYIGGNLAITGIVISGLVIGWLILFVMGLRS